MAKKRHTPEQVINKLREAEVAIAEGGTVAEAARRIGVTEQTFYVELHFDYIAFSIHPLRMKPDLDFSLHYAPPFLLNCPRL